jgi:hypothetical protein
MIEKCMNEQNDNYAKNFSFINDNNNNVKDNIFQIASLIYFLYSSNNNVINDKYLNESIINHCHNFLNNINLNNSEKKQEKIFLITKRGRPGKRITSYEKKYITHTKHKIDNILTKIQVSYINFLVDLINKILYEINRSDLHFLYLDGKFKKYNTTQKRKELMNATIGDIIKTEISAKYTTIPKNRNNIVYERLKNDNSLSEVMNILNLKFMFFFKNIYYHNLRKFNLKDFGLMDLEIELPLQFQLYENLLMKNKNDDKFELYKAKMAYCVKKYFLSSPKEMDKIKDDF